MFVCLLGLFNPDYIICGVNKQALRSSVIFALTVQYLIYKQYVHCDIKLIYYDYFYVEGLLRLLSVA